MSSGNSLEVRRTDKNSGWGCSHSCIIKQIIDIGLSATNVKFVELNRIIDYPVQIELMSNKYSDEFDLSIDESGTKLVAKRTDADSGWGHLHKCTIFRYKK